MKYITSRIDDDMFLFNGMKNDTITNLNHQYYGLFKPDGDNIEIDTYTGRDFRKIRELNNVTLKAFTSVECYKDVVDYSNILCRHYGSIRLSPVSDDIPIEAESDEEAIEDFKRIIKMIKDGKIQ